MNRADEVRKALTELAERGSPRSAEDMARGVLARLGDEAEVQPRPVAEGTAWNRRLAPIAAAVAALVGLAAVVVMAGDDDKDVDVVTDTSTTASTITEPTTPTTLPPAPGPTATWRKLSGKDLPAVSGGSLRSAAVAPGGGAMVAVGYEGRDYATAAVVFVSSNGTAWRRATGPFGTVGEGRRTVINSVVAVPSGFVAVGEVSAAGQFPDAAVWRSPDGQAWTRVTGSDAELGGAGTQSMVGAVARGSTLVATGVATVKEERDADFDVAVWTSDDEGATWSRVRGQAALEGSGVQSVSAIADTGDRFVIAGYVASRREQPGQAAAWASTDGRTWQAAELGTGPISSMRGLAVSRAGRTPLLVGVGVAGGIGGHAAVWTSTDGVAWRRSPEGKTGWFPESVRDIGVVTPSADGVLVAAVDFSSGQSRVFRSADGVKWTEDVLAPERNSFVQGAATGGGVELLLGDHHVPDAAQGEEARLEPVIWVRSRGARR